MTEKLVLKDLHGRQVEAFYAMLVASGEYTYLPELYDMFGRESTIRFLEVFAGTSFSVPTQKKLQTLARDVGIYVRIEKVGKRGQATMVNRLSEEYDLIPDRVRRIYAATKVKLEDDLGFKVASL